MQNDTHLQSKSRLQDYEPVVGRSTLEELWMLGEKFSGKIIQMINSTYVGGGVAEILEHMVPLLNQLGVDTRWDLITGDDEFYELTKKFNSALHGRPEKISAKDFTLFSDVTQQNLEKMKFYGDIIFVHDPQPVGLIAKKREIGKKWLWRCHVDVSNPNKRVWQFLRKFIVDYDAAVVSAPNFAHQLPIPQYLVTPSIDPLSDKNKELDPGVIKTVLEKYGLVSDKPMITQISRFDRLKDPIGVIEAFKIVRKNIDCQLVLAGGTATDDPAWTEVFDDVIRHAEGDPDIHILLVPAESDIEINALQRAATIIMQKSIREGFGLTISEALWKSKPVVASAVGGIPLQVKNKFTGLLCYTVEGAAYALRQLLTNPEYANWLGQNGKEHVKQNFLITGHLKNYLLMFLAVDHHSDVNYL
jgi:trehalose synthase